MSHLTRGAWIEICSIHRHKRSHLRSHLTRGAWIEIYVAVVPNFSLIVAPHTRCVD